MRLTKAQRTILKDIIKITVDLSGYDKSEYNNIKDVFLVEGAGFNPKSVKNWLQGLPSALTIPFYDFDILKLLKLIGVKVTDKNGSTLVEEYWDIMACFVYTLMMNREI